MSPPSKASRVQTIDHLAATPSYKDFLNCYLLPLKPCLISMPEALLWSASQRWLKQTDKGPAPDIDSLEQAFPDSTQVEVAFCEETDECGGQRRERMSFSEFAALWRESSRAKLYLKDFHFCIAGQSAAAYRTPEIFWDDWLNSHSISTSGGADDFRFVYLGQDGSSTNFHRDVYGSHSWSCSLAGIKRWRFLAPEYTHLVRDETTGDMPAGIFSPEMESRYPHIAEARERVLTVWQYPNEAIFVPSGWLHELNKFSCSETLSVNHNWANASCLRCMAKALEDEVHLGHLALDGFDLGSPEEVAVLVQDLTLRNFGWGWKEFFEMIKWRYVSACQDTPPPVHIKKEVAWKEAPDDLRPSPSVEGHIVLQVVQDWLHSNDSEYLPEARATAEEVLKHIQH
ncbi:Clavaminate synthase-like protein [Neolentinus lepideus HHB14362 ss-1]|uniref:Clavaminate synthase-like protein n=1 Tax=Neolentinus lepideus HHB14362 ss-1 TaxID=1314782 RepID=A0A165SWG4_9AGAM|nr:Clavaminate synthase-like protein [Neolentinus lepideus HHB14362 ss-1]